MSDWALNIVLAKMSNFKFKMMPKINREWKHNFRDNENPVRYL